MERRDTQFSTSAQAQEKFENAEQRFGDTYTLVDDETTKDFNAAGQEIPSSVTTYTVRGILQFDPDEALQQDVQGVESVGQAVFYTNDDRVDGGMRLREDNGDEWRIEAQVDRQEIDDGVQIHRKFRLRRADNQS